MRRTLILFAAAVVLVSGALLASSLAYLRGQAIASGERLTASLAQVIEEQTSRTVQTVDQQLQLAANRLTQLEASGGLNEASARTVLREQLKDLPFLRAMWVLDAQGRIAFDSDTGNIGVDLSQRAYVQAYRTRPDAGFQLGAPILSRTTGTWLIPATRPLRRSDGSIERLIVAAIEPPYFDSLWRGLEVGDGGSVTLFRKDGTLMMRSPFDPASMGKTFGDAPMFRLWMKGASNGSLQRASVVDGRPRLFAYRALSVQPELAVVAGQSLDLVLAPWRWLATVAIAAWAAACVAVIVMGVFLDRAWAASRRAEHEASETALRLSLATDAATIGVWDWDTRQATQWYATPTYFTMMGDPPLTDFGTRNEWLERLHPQDKQAVVERIAAVLAGSDVPYHYEARLRHADGSYRWVSVTGQVLDRDEHGKPTRMMGVRIDITERKQTEDALRNSEARYRELFYSNPQPMWVFDDETLAFLAVNTAAVVHYGYSEAEFLSMTIADMRPSEDRAALLNRVARPAEGLHNAGLHTHLRRDGSRILVEISTHSLDFGGRPARLVLSRDVTEMKRAQQALEDLNHQLEARVEARSRELEQTMAQLLHAEKLAALGSLVTGMAHELNTPIGNVLVVASTLKADVVRCGERLLAGSARRSEVAAWTTRLSEAGEMIEREAARAAKLIADFKLVAAGPESAKRQDFALLGLVERARQHLPALEAGGPHRVQIEVPSNIRMDSFPDALEQVLVNLLGNALLHAFSATRPGTVRVVAEPDGDQVVLRIEDDGCGMAEDVLRHVFDPFYTTRLGQGGSGLGLYIVYNLVTGLLGGSIKAESSPGQGTHFEMRLPRTGGPQPVGSD
ncbi:PAS domain S-box protein [Roseateles toxinivorans]|uniref:histidine kinase n=1 Tax=Roseateles toxinivorans TaxID=270368 RepID=A0A4R6QKM6_9BURK|nr:PAS domain S-box protein [Roseateles toxinivorans]TDP62484.1 PAS domain S-box-containing protein [Roseateles toxinivorans]